ncbi:uncharacterized protein BDR25DRAFT_267026 [Lindgomyces ingoldianus]|uniref:Uncharacterized protein n=1 Tax=Lindgomyces ingoldianus TaxID=673940 RepID=A0ACB6QKL6_9PLEO|nr:uncharacterized protein BDR25DRAFT_267026 [Lindgomyces ingoldianus]KAF2467549.1 hypothetical protein BDR25DRAFT_267026 [Lindgomyces ingoldianus]
MATSLGQFNSSTSTGYPHLSFECPFDSSKVVPKLSDSRQIRFQYINALQARSRAHARHHELKSLLDDLRNGHFIELPSQTRAQYDSDVTRGYVCLLRQRSRFSSLQVVQASLEKLLNVNPASTPNDPRSLVRDAVGEQPGLPLQPLELLTRYSDVEDWVFKLKKQVLESKAAMNGANSARAEAKINPQAVLNLKQQVYALGCARDEIVAWVQDELAKFPEESEFLENASPLKQSGDQSAALDTALSESHFREVYNRYTTSRASLLEALDSINRPARVCQAWPDRINAHTQGESQSFNHSNPPTTITNVLPQLQSLATSLREERALLLQAVYLQVQFSLAAEKANDSLSRLSEESHLLPSGSKELAAWAQTVAQAESATGHFVTAWLEDILQEVNSISTIGDLSSLQDQVLAHA